MSDVLVISDDEEINREMKVYFQKNKWTPVFIGMHAMIVRGSSCAEGYKCAVIVIDSDFRRRFGGLITELMPLVRNCSTKSHLYLVTESESPPECNMWMPHVSQAFMLEGKRAVLHEALDKIMHLEWQPLPITAFVSPMHSE